MVSVKAAEAQRKMAAEMAEQELQRAHLKEKAVEVLKRVCAMELLLGRAVQVDNISLTPRVESACAFNSLKVRFAFKAIGFKLYHFCTHPYT